MGSRFILELFLLVFTNTRGKQANRSNKLNLINFYRVRLQIWFLVQDSGSALGAFGLRVKFFKV